MNEYILPDNSAGVTGDLSPLATREYFYSMKRKEIEGSLKLALDQLQMIISSVNNYIIQKDKVFNDDYREMRRADKELRLVIQQTRG